LDTTNNIVCAMDTAVLAGGGGGGRMPHLGRRVLISVLLRREAYIHTNINANIFFNQDENKDIFISTTILLDSNTYRSIWIEVLWFINVSITYFGLFVDIGSTGWRWRWRWNRIEWMADLLMHVHYEVITQQFSTDYNIESLLLRLT
ncbi:hypothetical protein ACJX0J_012173, partial [Zea mays]